MALIYIERDLETKEQIGEGVLFDTIEGSDSYFQGIPVKNEVMELLKSDSELGADLALQIAEENK